MALPSVRVSLASVQVPSVARLAAQLVSVRLRVLPLIKPHARSRRLLNQSWLPFTSRSREPPLDLAVAQQGVPVLNPCSVMFQRSFSATWCFTAGSLHPLARSRTVEFGVSLRPCFNNFQHIELNLSGPRAALGRSRAQVRDAGRVLSGLVSRFRQALLDGSFWLALLPKRGKFWGSQVLLKGLKWSAVFQSLVLG